jgi:hypothetical protein
MARLLSGDYGLLALLAACKSLISISGSLRACKRRPVPVSIAVRVRGPVPGMVVAMCQRGP